VGIALVTERQYVKKRQWYRIAQNKVKSIDELN
jgi:hypothetical protein